MFTQYQLPYAFSALEPHIDALTMETHYLKHHAAYTKNLNDAVLKAGEDNREIVDLLSHLDSIPDESLRTAIRNNGGGFYNHNLYFSTLNPGGSEPDGEFAAALNRKFGDFNTFKEEISKIAASRFGSGWAWLSVDRDNRLVLSSTPNQDNPLMEGKGLTPIFGIDVWEHAYYLKYRNMRADYIKALFNVVSWQKVAENYDRIVSRNRNVE